MILFLDLLYHFIVLDDLVAMCEAGRCPRALRSVQSIYFMDQLFHEHRDHGDA